MDTSKKRKKLSLEEKISVIEAVNKGSSQRSVAKLFEVSKTQVQHIIATKDELLLEYQESTNSNAPKPKRHRKTNNEEINEATLNWYHERKANGLPLSGSMLQEKALEVARQSNNQTFKASNGWLHAFIRRNNIVLRECLSGTTIASATEITETPSDKPTYIIGTGDTAAGSQPSTSNQPITDTYQVQDIFNFIETTILFRALPDKTLTSLVEESKKGKMATERITVGFCCNLTGSEKETPLVIGTSNSIHEFFGLDTDLLPVSWEIQNNSWMTSDLFDKWLQLFDKKMKTQGRKTLLWVEYSPCHQVNAEVTSVRIMYYPRPQLQPLYRGIVDAIKKSYRQMLLQAILTKRYQYDSLDKLLQSVTLLDACYWLHYSWDCITSEQIISSWQKAGFPVVCTANPSPQEDHNPDDIAQSILEILGLEGTSLEDFYACDLDLPVCAEDGKEALTLEHGPSKPNYPPDQPTINTFEDAAVLVQQLKQFAATKNNLSILNAVMGISKEINWQVVTEHH